jgi:hypothetical protein
VDKDSELSHIGLFWMVSRQLHERIVENYKKSQNNLSRLSFEPSTSRIQVCTIVAVSA